MTSLATDKPKDYSTFLNNRENFTAGAEVNELRRDRGGNAYDFFKTHIENRTVGSMYVSSEQAQAKLPLLQKPWKITEW